MNLLIDIPAVSVLYRRGAMHEYRIRYILCIVVNSTIEEPDISSPLIAASRHACEGVTSNSCPRQTSDSPCHRHNKTSVFQFFQQVHSTKVEINYIRAIHLPFLSTWSIFKVVLKISLSLQHMCKLWYGCLCINLLSAFITADFSYTEQNIYSAVRSHNISL